MKDQFRNPLQWNCSDTKVPADLKMVRETFHLCLPLSTMCLLFAAPLKPRAGGGGWHSSDTFNGLSLLLLDKGKHRPPHIWLSVSGLSVSAVAYSFLSANVTPPSFLTLCLTAGPWKSKGKVHLNTSRELCLTQDLQHHRFLISKWMNQPGNWETEQGETYVKGASGWKQTLAAHYTGLNQWVGRAQTFVNFNWHYRDLHWTKTKKVTPVASLI